jgi:subtilisin family serine protease
MLAERPIRRLRSVPILALEVDLPTLEALRRDPLVHSIAEDALLLPQLQASMPQIGAPAAWEQGFAGDGWTIAVLDTGIDRSHPFLTDAVVEEACFSTSFALHGTISLCPNGALEQHGPGAATNCTGAAEPDAGELLACGHGTHVAGIAAGSGEGMSGVAPGARIIAIQVFSKQQMSDGTTRLVAYSSDVLAALEYVYSLRDTYSIAAVNLSLSTATPYHSAAACASSSAYGAAYALIEQLRAAGIATIAATGNSAYADGIGAPACLANVISVGATTPAGLLWSDSNSAAFVDLLAPGVSIRSAFPVQGFPGFDTFLEFSGTSQAAAHVSGAWAVLKEAVPTASVAQIADALRASGQPIHDSRNGVAVPRIQLDAALAALQATSQPTLSTPQHVRATPDGDVSVPVLFATHGLTVTDVAFCVRFSPEWLAPATADELLYLPTGRQGELTSSDEARLCVEVGATDTALLSTGELARIRFALRKPLPQEGEPLVYLDTEPPPEYTGPAGQRDTGEIAGGSLLGVRIRAALHTIYLPAASK